MQFQQGLLWKPVSLLSNPSASEMLPVPQNTQDERFMGDFFSAQKSSAISETTVWYRTPRRIVLLSLLIPCILLNVHL
jgi:hypothetical protein